MPKISVIVPVYNKEKYLSKCLDSILNQTFKDIEIICVNDGSTDKSLSILQDYAKQNKQIKIISQQNQGLSAARNTGMLKAKGKWITFIDPDDYIDAETYETALNKIYDKTELICFGIKTFGKSTKEQKQSDKNYYKINYDGVVQATDAVIWNTDCSVCNKLFDASIIKKYDIKFPEGLNYEDACFYFKYASLIQKILFIPKYFYHYLRHEDSIMAQTFSKTDKALDHLYIVENIFNFYQKNAIFEAKKDLFEKQFVAYYYFAKRYVLNEQKAIDLALELIYKLHLDKYYPNNELILDIINKNKAPINKQTFSIKLFNFIPIFKCTRRAGKIVYKILGLPIWKVRHHENNITTRHYLLGIPFIKISKK